MTVHEIENAVASLTSDELTAFAKWFESYCADARDEQLRQTFALED